MDKELYALACRASTAEALAMRWNLLVDGARRPTNPEEALALAVSVGEGTRFTARLGEAGFPEWIAADGNVVAVVFTTGTAVAV